MFELVYHDTSMRQFFTNDDTCIFVLIKRNTFIWPLAVAASALVTVINVSKLYLNVSR